VTTDQPTTGPQAAGQLDVDLDMDRPESRTAWTQAYGGHLPVRGTLRRIGVIPHGMTSGRPSLAMLATLDDGQQVFLETSWRNFALAAVALISRWGTP
jgi:hypothetical protein